MGAASPARNQPVAGRIRGEAWLSDSGAARRRGNDVSGISAEARHHAGAAQAAGGEKMIRWTALMAAASVAIVLCAQQNRAPESRGGAARVETLHVQGNVYLLTGAGANIAVQLGEQTVVLVDS